MSETCNLCDIQQPNAHFFGGIYHGSCGINICADCCGMFVVKEETHKVELFNENTGEKEYIFEEYIYLSTPEITLVKRSDLTEPLSKSDEEYLKTCT